MKAKLAKKYFSYVAKNFPVMCASGAFPMLPPVTDAAKHLDRLDDLSRRAMTKHIAALNGFKQDFLNAAAKTQMPEIKAQAPDNVEAIGAADHGCVNFSGLHISKCVDSPRSGSMPRA